MKLKTYSLLVACLTLLQCMLPTEHAEPSALSSTGLLLHYSFNGNANDESGNGRNGNVFGGSWTLSRNTEFILARTLDGIDDYMEIPYDQAFNFNGGFTISIWFKMNGYTGEHNHIVSRLIWNAPIWWEQNPYCVWVKRSTGTLNFGMRGHEWGDYYGKSWREVTVPFVPEQSELKQWHHVVAVYNASHMMSIYLDGQLKGEAVGPSKVFCDSVSPIYLGADDNEGNNHVADGFFNGSIDELRIYNRALNSREVDSLWKDPVLYTSFLKLM